MAAVDYGIANLASLKEAGYNIDGLNDAEKAKIIYLTHHLGLSDAKRFINNEITENSAKKLLTAQVGEESAKSRSKTAGYVKAHKKWLIDYINRNIKLSEYFCHEQITSNSLEDIDLIETIKKINEEI